jgi:hypothetical protein
MAVNQFSTDNAQSDQMQIDCEQYDPDEEYPYGQPDPDHEIEDDGPEMMTAYAGTRTCRWWETDEIKVEDLPAWKVRMMARHAEECGCGSELIF